MLSERLKSLRNELNLTQEEVSNKINVSRQAYANWETNRGEPSIELLLNLANLYKVSLDYLCGKSDIRDNIYDDPTLCKYINKCVGIFDEFFKDKDQE